MRHVYNDVSPPRGNSPLTSSHPPTSWHLRKSRDRTCNHRAARSRLSRSFSIRCFPPRKNLQEKCRVGSCTPSNGHTTHLLQRRFHSSKTSGKFQQYRAISRLGPHSSSLCWWCHLNETGLLFVELKQIETILRFSHCGSLWHINLGLKFRKHHQRKRSIKTSFCRFPLESNETIHCVSLWSDFKLHLNVPHRSDSSSQLISRSLSAREF